MKLLFENIGRLIVLLLLQLLLINNLHFMGVCNPCLYILFLIALPAELPNWAELFIGAFVGMIMDIACSTPGVHMAACVALSYNRPRLLHKIIPDDDRLIGTLSTRIIDMPSFIRIVLTLTLLHHTILFLLLNFTFHAFWLTVIQILVSSFMTILLIVGREFLRK